MQTLLAFLVAIGLLVAVHEWGHFSVARWCGVKVLRFSIGFGPKIWGTKSKKTGTEFVLCAIPLGGYVRMLDGREGMVADHEKPFAFDSQSLLRRSAIVVAGPIANLLLAVLLYAVVNWQVVPQAAPVLPVPTAGSLAAEAGWSGGERIAAMGLTTENMVPIQTFEELRWWLTKASLDKQAIYLQSNADNDSVQLRTLSLGALDASAADAGLFQKIGWGAPFSNPVMGEISKEGRASLAGLRQGDVVLSVNGARVVDASQLRAWIRNSPEMEMQWRVMRDKQPITLVVRPTVERQGTETIGRVGAYIGAPPEMVKVQYGALEGLRRAVQKTWDVSRMSLLAMFQMVTGQVSLRHLNGPLAIAEYAGKSAALGMQQFTSFLALISISLGVLNLLPLPVLDGGHLMYYLWEGAVGRPVPQRWWEMLQRAGIALLLVMMSIAFYNDILHIWG